MLHEGSGKTPKEGDTVLMHYEIWSTEGITSSEYDYDKKAYIDDIHDSTYDQNNPFHGPIEIIIGQETPKDDVYSKGDSIKGIDEALLKMRSGSKCALLIPPSLGYGEEGASSFHTFHGYRAPPHKDMRCNIELVKINNSDG